MGMLNENVVQKAQNPAISKLLLISHPVKKLTTAKKAINSDYAALYRLYLEHSVTGSFFLQPHLTDKNIKKKLAWDRSSAVAIRQ
jgi:hypothetical protein